MATLPKPPAQGTKKPLVSRIQSVISPDAISKVTATDNWKAARVSFNHVVLPEEKQKADLLAQVLKMTRDRALFHVIDYYLENHPDVARKVEALRQALED